MWGHHGGGGGYSSSEVLQRGKIGILYFTRSIISYRYELLTNIPLNHSCTQSNHLYTTYELMCTTDLYMPLTNLFLTCINNFDFLYKLQMYVTKKNREDGI